jgi:hypothetical protein
MSDNEEEEENDHVQDGEEDKRLKRFIQNGLKEFNKTSR